MVHYLITLRSRIIDALVASSYIYIYLWDYKCTRARGNLHKFFTVSSLYTRTRKDLSYSSTFAMDIYSVEYDSKYLLEISSFTSPSRSRHLNELLRDYRGMTSRGVTPWPFYALFKVCVWLGNLVKLRIQSSVSWRRSLYYYYYIYLAKKRTSMNNEFKNLFPRIKFYCRESARRWV